MNSSALLNDSLITIDVEIGGLAYFLSNLSTYLPYAILLLISILIGTIGNLMVMIVILSDKSLRHNSTFILIMNLAIADSLISSFTNSTGLLDMFLGNLYFSAQKESFLHLNRLCLFCFMRHVAHHHGPLGAEQIHTNLSSSCFI